MAVALASTTGSSPYFNTGVAPDIEAKVASVITSGATTGVIIKV